MAELTRKQASFVERYLLDLNSTKAARDAGYSQKAATQIGYDLLQIPKVKAAINAAIAERSRATGVDAAWVLKRLVEEAEADIGDLYESDGKLKPIHEWPHVFRTGLVASVETEPLFEGTAADRKHVGTRYKVRFSDRIRRIELIGKHVRVTAFEDQISISGIDNLAARLARAKKRSVEHE